MAHSRPGGSTHRTRVLVAEDDAALRRLLEIRLGVEAYDVEAVEDGADALGVAAARPPDVLVCDVMMPRVSGLTVCRELRSDDRFADLPIILLTARVFDEDIEQVMRLGGISFMNKPFNLDELIANIEAVAHNIPGEVRGEARAAWPGHEATRLEPPRAGI